MVRNESYTFQLIMIKKEKEMENASWIKVRYLRCKRIHRSKVILLLLDRVKNLKSKF